MFQVLDAKKRQFLDLLDNDLQPIKPSYLKNLHTPELQELLSTIYL